MFLALMTELMAAPTGAALQSIREGDPDRYDNLHRAFIASVEVATEFLKSSPEFREAFGRVHAEFLRYPESRGVMHQALLAWNRFGQEEAPTPRH